MNILLEGIICREPADTELQSRGGGGGGGGGFVDSQTSRSLDSFLSLADTELRPVVCRLRKAWETYSLLGEWGGEGSLILKILDHLIP